VSFAALVCAVGYEFAISEDADAQSTFWWAPPALTNPTTINVPATSSDTNGKTSLALDTTRDYIVKLPSTTKYGMVHIEGGRNIHVIGGHISPNPNHNTSNSDWTNRAIYIRDNAGTVHIEGVLIDDSSGGQSDGIVVNSPNSIVQIENVRVSRLSGNVNQVHADIVDTSYGGAREVRMNRFTGYSNYQGLFIQAGTTLIAQNVNVGYASSPYAADSAGSLQFIWLTPGTTSCTHNPTSLTEVYVLPRSDQTLNNSVWPTTTRPAACPASVANNVATWPNLTSLTGSVKGGTPPGGDFVPPGVAGVNYVPPG
jgi:hypothetical protein